MQNKPQQHIIFHMCPPWALKDLHKYHVSVVGKITSIDKENDSMELLLDPKEGTTVKVIVNEFDFKYLFREADVQKLRGNQQYRSIDKLVNPQNYRNESQKHKQREVEWFAVRQGEDRQIIKQLQRQELAKAEMLKTAAPAQPTKKINVDYFHLDDYIQVRGQGTGSGQIQLIQFTIFQHDFDLQIYNQTLQKATAYCQHMFY